jgi:hypothetical protein
MAWSVLSFLVVPILVVEQKGPFAAFKESSVLLKRTWGERLIGNSSFGLIFFLLLLPAIALVAVGGMLASNAHSASLFIACIGIAVVYGTLLMLVNSALHAIFQAAVYLHAAQPATIASGPRGFPVQLLSNAMTAK